MGPEDGFSVSSADQTNFNTFLRVQSHQNLTAGNSPGGNTPFGKENSSCRMTDDNDIVGEFTPGNNSDGTSDVPVVKFDDGSEIDKFGNIKTPIPMLSSDSN